MKSSNVMGFPLCQKEAFSIGDIWENFCFDSRDRYSAHRYILSLENKKNGCRGSYPISHTAELTASLSNRMVPLNYYTLEDKIYDDMVVDYYS